jgi:L-2,4-diaminobutyrate decarboxylase
LQSDRFDADFLSASPAGQAAFRHALSLTADALVGSYADLDRCYAGGSPQQIAAEVAAIDVCPEIGIGMDRTIANVADLVLRQSVLVADPTCLGHLHCPPLIPAIAAEVLISATNQSMDSWDQAPAATYLEQHVVDWMGRLFDLGEDADGIFTSGGTQSNFMALLLARNLVGNRHGWNIRQFGMPAQAFKLRILCSQAAHFSIQQSAAILGMGEDCVIGIPTDEARRMRTDALADTIAQLKADGLIPFLVVATAGTTDFGSIDPLGPIADICAAEDLWLHVDAAYGGALAISERFKGLLAGIDRADSITVDFHKLFYQPISCSTFLVRRRGDFDAISLHADYLNPEENVEEGVLDLVTKSIQTTRRFDGLKPFMTLQALGRRHLADMIENTVDLAQDIAELIEADPDLRLAAWPAIIALVFRFCVDDEDPLTIDAVNREVRRSMLAEGKALLAGTKIDGRIWLKLTVLNPRTTIEHMRTILNDVSRAGRAQLALLHPIVQPAGQGA